MQAHSSGIRGLVVMVLAALATLATIAPALADVRSGPWPS